ncbi:MAG TPA: class I adenylate-forming enzyme family protein [Stellaceae bacterium]|nr:class I adenylate-forming enzyme family protein [Stellaceae bacterium]
MSRAMTWDNLSDAIFDHAARQADAPALIQAPATLSYRDFAALVAKASVYLRDLGIGERTRVGIALGNSIDHFILYFALMRVGAVPAELPVEDSGDKLVAAAQRYNMRAIFTEAQVTLSPGVTQHRMMPDWRDTLGALNGDHRALLGADELHTITLTTGSTGVPGGIITTHRQFSRRIEAQRAIYKAHRLFEPPAGTLVLPASIRFGPFFRSLLGQILAGGATVITPDFAKPIELLRTIAAYDDAVAFVTANLCRLFIAAAPESTFLFPRMRLLVSVGMPLYAAELRAVIARVTPNYYYGYGTTGIASITALPPGEIAHKAGTVGRPVADVTVEIVDERDRCLPAGSYGNIRCRSELVSLGRCEEDESESAEQFRDGWYYPGDIGMLDPDGYLILRGRVAEVIRSGATEVFAPEVAAAIAAHPGVAEVAVVGIPSPQRGEEIVAFVVKRGTLDHEELVRHCRGVLTPPQRPEHIYYMDGLPRIAGGKVDRARLQSLALSEAMRRGR